MRSSNFLNTLASVLIVLLLPVDRARSETTVDQGQQNVTSTQFECPTQFGYYASAQSDAHKFWLCVNGVAHEFTCPVGTHFNVHENQCTEWIEEVSGEHETKEKQQSTQQHISKPHRKNHHSRHSHKTKNPRKLSQILHKIHQRIDELDHKIDKLYERVDNRSKTDTDSTDTTRKL